MSGRSRPKRANVRGKSTKAQFAPGLADIVLETVRVWRKHHLGYDQTKYIVEQARRHLKLQLLGTRRRTVDCLDKSGSGTVDPPQVYLTHCKKESNRYVPVLPALVQELRTHFE